MEQPRILSVAKDGSRAEVAVGNVTLCLGWRGDRLALAGKISNSQVWDPEAAWVPKAAWAKAFRMAAAAMEEHRRKHRKTV